MEKQLYQWQEKCLEQWFSNQCRGIVEAVTGSGKTLLALTAMRRLDDMLEQKLRVKIVVPTGALMRQWDKALREFLAKAQGEEMSPANVRREIGLRGSGYKSALDLKYMIYIINSARYELARQILSELRAGEQVLLIADECHHYQSGENQLIFEFLPHIKLYEEHFFSLGLSATLPSGQARQYLTSVLGRKIYSYGMEKALAFCTVSSYDIFHIGLSFQAEEKGEYEDYSSRMQIIFTKLIKMYPTLKKMNQKELFEMLRAIAGDKNSQARRLAANYMTYAYKRRSLVCLASARISCVCELVRRLEPGRKIMIFGERISQAEELYQLLEKQCPGRVGRFHSKMGEQANKNALERFRIGDFRILIACKSLDEGVDVPDASVGVILSGTSAKRQRVQRLGRIIRKKEEGSRAALYYLHIEESSEDLCYLPDTRQSRIFELKYSSDTGYFSNPLYDKAAITLWKEMLGRGMEQEQMREVRRCLKLGCVRADWRREQKEFDEQIKKASNMQDRNYWVCMKQLRNMRGGKNNGQ